MYIYIFLWYIYIFLCIDEYYNDDNDDKRNQNYLDEDPFATKKGSGMAGECVNVNYYLCMYADYKHVCMYMCIYSMYAWYVYIWYAYMYVC